MEATRPEHPTSADPSIGWRRAFATAGLLLLLGAGAVVGGHRLASSALIDVGPTDETYAEGFRDIERDGPVYFRWSSVPSSRITLPLRACGPGMVRMRLRRHFADPAMLSVSLSGLTIGQKAVAARTDHPYEVVTFPYSQVSCDALTNVLLESSVENARPLGVAVDWVEVSSSEGFRASSATVVQGAALAGLAGLGLLVTGGSSVVALSAGALTSAGLLAAFSSEPVVAERVLRGCLYASILVACFGFAIARLAGLRGMSSRQRSVLFGITLGAVLLRGAFLHPQAFYPDYRVHALVQQTLSRVGLPAFLEQLFEIQYARSLGLQQAAQNWYPFPYPPGSYILTSGVARLFELGSMDASIVAAIAFGSLIPVLTAALAVALGLGESIALWGAFYVALQPLLIRRMALGYFPGIAGQFVDAVTVLLFVNALGARRGNVKALLAVSVSMTGAFLVYTQSVANFGLLIAGLLTLEAVRPSLGGRPAALRIALAGALALSASVGCFYFRYFPVFENAASHQPQPEAHVLDRLEQLRKNASLDSAVADEDVNDPWSGPTLNPARGVSRLGSRLWRFNGPFVLAILAGLWLLLSRASAATRNLLLAWSAVSVWISVLAAGLPSPNGFQHLKDLEFVAPLLAVSTGILTARLMQWRPAAAALLASAWILYSGVAFAQEWSARLLPIFDH